MKQGYGSREYWEARYARGAGPPEDWLQTFAGLRASLEAAVPRAGRVLVIGCGSSRLDEEMLDAGWTSILSVDYARGVLTQRSARKGLTFMAMDVRRLALATGSFAAVVDKSTLDAIACLHDGTSVDDACREIARVLAPGGTLYSVSLSRPPLRQPVLERALGGPVTAATVAKMKPTPGLDPELAVNWVYVGKRPA